MSETRAMSAQDSLWLTMDRPNNLMVIDGVLLLRGEPDWEAIVEVARERVLERFPVFRCRPVRSGVGWAWEPDPEFDLRRHVQRTTLPEPAGMRQLEDFVAAQRSRPMSHGRPLWDITLVERVVLDDGERGAAVVSRFHHAIADGVRLTMVMLSLCDTDDPAVSATVARPSGASGVREATSAALGVTWEAISDGARAAASAGRSLAQDAGAALRDAAELGAGLLRNPGRLDTVFEAAGLDNRLANDVASVAKLALSGRSVRTVWSGTPGTRKAVAWSAPFPLDEVRRVGREHGASVNDVLITAVGGGLRRYLDKHGDPGVDDVTWMVPVNLVPFSENLPEDLGNFFALVMVVLPTTPADPVERLAEVSRRVGRIKHSDEPALTFGIQRGISAAPRAASVALTNFFADKAVGVLTNVPGPRAPMTFAGSPVEQIVGFAPCSGDQPMTATIFSYAGSVTIGFAVDADLITDPRLLVDGTIAELRALVGVPRE